MPFEFSGTGRKTVGEYSYGEDIPLGQMKEDEDGNKTYWSGQNYGYQSYESYQQLGNKGYFAGRTGGRQPGHEAVFGQESAARTISSAKELAKGALRSVTTGEQRQNLRRGIDLNMSLAGMVFNYHPQAKMLMQGLMLLDKGYEQASRPLNIGKTQLELVETVATAGTSGPAKGAMTLTDLVPKPRFAMQLAGIPGDASWARQQLDNVMRAVTTTDEEVLGSVRGGIKPGDKIVTGDQGKQLADRAAKIEEKSGFISQINEHLTALKELATDPKNLAIYVKNNPLIDDLYKRKKGDLKGIAESLRARKKDAMEALSQWQSNVLPFDKEGPNQNWFRTTAGLAAKTAEQKIRGLSDWLHQHHLFPKGISAAYFSKMDELIAANKATPDDLVAMAEFAANQGRRPGDVRANLLNMIKAPHDELHKILRKQGAEIPKEKIQEFLKDVDSVDDLMALWKEVLAGDVAYNIGTAKIWEPLDKLIKDVQGK